MVERDPAKERLVDEKFEDFSDSGSVDLEISSPPARKRTHHILIIAIVAALGLMSVIFVTAFKWRTTSEPKWDQCGTSAAEARARGCVFEATGFTWLPKECYDPETEAEFLQYVADNDLKLYHDHKYTKVASTEEIRKGEGKGYFTHEGYHLAHCLFLFKKLHRAYAAGKVVDGYIISLNHTAHCVEQSLSVSQNADYRKEMIQFSYTKWPNCGKPGGYNLIWAKQGEWTDY